MGRILESELEMVERHVRRGGAIIEQQRALIEHLRKAGLPAVEAESLLDLFEKIQERHLQHLVKLGR